MGKRPQNRVENGVEIPADIFGEESQYEVAVFLQQRVFVSVASVGLGIRQVLRSVNFDHKTGFRTQEIDIHPTAGTEPNGQRLVDPKSSCRRG